MTRPSVRVILRRTFDLITYPTRRPRVLQLRCNHCQHWVTPRRYDPTYDVCTRCLPAAKAHRRAQIRANERAHEQWFATQTTTTRSHR